MDERLSRARVNQDVIVKPGLVPRDKAREAVGVSLLNPFEIIVSCRLCEAEIPVAVELIVDQAGRLIGVCVRSIDSVEMPLAIVRTRESLSAPTGPRESAAAA